MEYTYFTIAAKRGVYLDVCVGSTFGIVVGFVVSVGEYSHKWDSFGEAYADFEKKSSL